MTPQNFIDIVEHIVGERLSGLLFAAGHSSSKIKFNVPEINDSIVLDMVRDPDNFIIITAMTKSLEIQLSVEHEIRRFTRRVNEIANKITNNQQPPTCPSQYVMINDKKTDYIAKDFSIKYLSSNAEEDIIKMMLIV